MLEHEWYDRRSAEPVRVAADSGRCLWVSQELPRARLLTLDGYGHTSFGKSTCVEQFETSYLVSLRLPPVGAVCKPDQQPFSGPPTGVAATLQQAVSTATRPPLPGMPRITPFA